MLIAVRDRAVAGAFRCVHPRSVLGRCQLGSA